MRSTIALSAAALLLSPRLASAVPIPSPTLDSAPPVYTVAEGQASGNDFNGLGLLNGRGIFADNAGHGGKANSGNAFSTFVTSAFRSLFSER
jgi:hypothetical protein